MIVAGVDLGIRKAAVCVIGEGHNGSTVHTVSAFTSTARTRSTELRDVAAWVYTKTQGADAVYIEEPPVGRGGIRVSLQLSQTVGAVLSMLTVPAYPISNTAWKKALVGTGTVGKNLIAEWLDELHPGYSRCCDGDQDRIDATCIALYGRQQSFVASRLRQGLGVSGA